VTAIHQLLPVFSSGDAIGQAVRRMRAEFREAGLRSEVFAEAIDQRLQAEARPAGQLESSLSADDWVLYHLSIGAPAARLFEGLRCRRAIVYHNITPAHYFREASPGVTHRLEQGRRDLARLAPQVALGIGDSEFNAAELRAAGCTQTMVIPPPVDLARLHPRPSRPSDPPLLLFVSRLAPNKRQDHLVRVLAALRATAQPSATLSMPGGWHDTGSYVGGIRRLARDLGVEDAVSLPGRLGDSQLGDLYARASVAVCASEHEGFAMHLLEAWAFDVPVVARAAAAVPETLGDAGMLLSGDDPLLWAAVVDRVIRDRSLREGLAERGRRRLASFSGTELRAQVARLLDRLGLCDHALSGGQPTG